MKKIILITATMLFAISAKAQQSYTPWSQFANDTLAYLQTNFEVNKARYVGYPLEKVINDYELPLLSTIPESASLSYKTRVKSITFDYIPYNKLIHRSRNRIQFHTIYIYLKEPSPSYEYYIQNQSREGDTATRARLDAMLFKDNIVDSIRVYTIKYNPPAPPVQRAQQQEIPRDSLGRPKLIMKFVTTGP